MNFPRIFIMQIQQIIRGMRTFGAFVSLLSGVYILIRAARRASSDGRAAF